jgi:Family of unknown function (DUF6433)
MKRHVKEILEDIQASPEKISVYKESAVLRILFEYAFDPSKKFILPETTPPYKKDDSPYGMSPINFQNELKKLYIFCRVDLKPIRREMIFIQLLEGIHPEEASILLAVKEQNLTGKYSNITHKMAFDNGFIQILPPVAPLVQLEKVEVPVVEETKSLETEKVHVEQPVKVRGKPGPKKGWLKRKIEEAARVAAELKNS